MATQRADPQAGHGREALVIGASLAGLLAARVLAEHFDRVTLIERDAVHDAPESRKGQPHTRHIHALLPSGYGVLRELFEGLDEDLRAGGAIEADMGEGVRFHAGGGFAAQGPTGLRGVFVSRPFLEWRLARRVRRIRNVRVLDRHKVTGLIAGDGGRIGGVRAIDLGDGEREKALRADLAVDASGRGSSTPRWLETLGFDAPRETLVKIDLTYTTRIYRRERAGDTQVAGIIINPDVPASPRLGSAFPIERDRWIVTVGGWGGDECPPDERAHRAFLRSLAAPDLGALVDELEPLTDFYRYRFAANRRRHYEKLKRFPGGLLVIGDAVASFNPVYGQGMSSAAFQVKELQRGLGEREPLESLWKPYFKRGARIVDRAWQLAVGADFAFPETEGPKPPGTDLVNRYIKRLSRAAHRDMALVRAFIDVQNLLAPPASLFRPDRAWRVLRPMGAATRSRRTAQR